MRWVIVLTLALALGDDLVVGNLAMPRMTMIWMVGLALGVAAAHLWLYSRPR